MDVGLALVLFGAGLALVMWSAERLVGAVVGTSLGFGLSTFFVSVVFIGFDPENLAVGMAGAARDAPGIALGSIIGAAMVAVALAFGLTALIVPMRFERVPWSIASLPLAAILLLDVLCLDGRLSRLDGALLLMAFGGAIAWLYRLGRRGLDIRSTGEVAEVLERPQAVSRWRTAAWLVVSLAGIIIGSELLVRASQSLIARLGLSETTFGMTVLAFVVSIEELARELPAAWKGRPEISYGNVVGSALAFFCFNAGVIALARPIDVDPESRAFYLPVCTGTVCLLALLMRTQAITRWSGALLILAYLFFAVGGGMFFGD